MKQYVKVILSVTLVAFIVSSMSTICMGYSMYKLGVKVGDWVEYKVVEAENYEFFVKIRSGDKLRFKVLDVKIQEKMYPNGTVAFEVEVPVCDVFLNGESIQRNVTLSEMLILPNGEEHWRDLEKIEEIWKKEAPKYGIIYESNITIGQDTVLFSYRMENAVNGGTKQIIHKDTGVALEFERYFYAGKKKSECRLLISDTSVSGILTPWYITYWYLIALLVVVVIIVFAALLKCEGALHKLRKGATARFLALTIGLTLTEIAYRIISEDLLTLTSLTISLLSGFILSFFLTWLVSLMKLQRLHIFALIWLNLFIVRYFSNMVEGYFFTSVFVSLNDFLSKVFTTLIVTLIEGAITCFLLTTKDTKSLAASIREHLSTRSKGSWIIRFVAGSVIYFPIYFLFGALISPFIIEYYSESSLGLKIPSFTVIIPLEFFRGFLYVVTLLPIIATVKDGKGTSFIVPASILFILGAFIPLIAEAVEASLPLEIIPFHLLEILADSLVYGFALSRILGKAGEAAGSIHDMHVT